MLGEAISGAVAAAGAAVDGLGLTEEVAHESYLGPASATGGKVYADPVARRAMVQRKDGMLRTAGGQERRYRAILCFLAPLAVDPMDRFKLSDGTTGPIVLPEGGLTDPATKLPYVRLVHLGGG